MVVPSVTFSSPCGPTVFRATQDRYRGRRHAVLESLLSASDRPDFVSFESDRKTISALRSELSLLTRLGYRRFQLVDQKTVQKQEQPRPAREGRTRTVG